jgi:hypothetical protein
MMNSNSALEKMWISLYVLHLAKTTAGVLICFGGSGLEFSEEIGFLYELMWPLETNRSLLWTGSFHIFDRNLGG